MRYNLVDVIYYIVFTLWTGQCYNVEK